MVIPNPVRLLHKVDARSSMKLKTGIIIFNAGEHVEPSGKGHLIILVHQISVTPRTRGNLCPNWVGIFLVRPFTAVLDSIASTDTDVQIGPRNQPIRELLCRTTTDYASVRMCTVHCALRNGTNARSAEGSVRLSKVIRREEIMTGSTGSFQGHAVLDSQ
jgi:hypothetical protein